MSACAAEQQAYVDAMSELALPTMALMDARSALVIAIHYGFSGEPGTAPAAAGAAAAVRDQRAGWGAAVDALMNSSGSAAAKTRLGAARTAFDNAGSTYARALAALDAARAAWDICLAKEDKAWTGSFTAAITSPIRRKPFPGMVESRRGYVATCSLVAPDLLSGGRNTWAVCEANLDRQYDLIKSPDAVTRLDWAGGIRGLYPVQIAVVNGVWQAAVTLPGTSDGVLVTAVSKSSSGTRSWTSRTELQTAHLRFDIPGPLDGLTFRGSRTSPWLDGAGSDLKVRYTWSLTRVSP